MSIKLGYSVGDNVAEVTISPAHLIVTGLTQKAGKTTCLESLIKRSKKRAIVFRTKPGEKSFLQGTIIPPYFKDKSDWQYIQSLIESTIKERLRSFERAKIIKLCKQTGGNSLLEFKKKVDERLLNEKLNMFESDILTNIQAYLEIVLPKLQTIRFSEKLNLVDGLNIIDLERFSRDNEVQSLIISSTVEEVLHNFKNTIVVIPEAWKFIPQGKGNPCKAAIEEFVRQGATNNNFIWIDSQDITNTEKATLKQISTWLMGYQSEFNEVKRTLEQIPLPKTVKPKPDDIMSLKTGEFYLAMREGLTKIYVQPFWLDNETAINIAMGIKTVNDIDVPMVLPPKVFVPTEPIYNEIDFKVGNVLEVEKELKELRIDFFEKIRDLQNQINVITQSSWNQIKPKEIDEESIVAKVLQKIEVPTFQPMQVAKPDINDIVNAVISKIPQNTDKVYEVMPLEKIKKNFLEASKKKILAEATELNPKEIKMFFHIEAQNKEIKTNEIIAKAWLQADGSSARVQVSQSAKTLLAKNFIRKGSHGGFMPNLKSRLESDLVVHGATNEEIENLYNHIFDSLLKERIKEIL